MEGGKMFIQTDVLPQPRDTILDLGCGTGELSAYIAELVGPEGSVVGVDPDSNRVKLAQETHRAVKNLSFVEGNSDNFEGMSSEKYDIVFLNHVLHWIPNKEDAFRNMFSSLKAGGKIAMQYVDRLYPFIASALEEFATPENVQRCKNMSYRVPRSDVDRMCQEAGFDVVKSYQCNDKKIVFENTEDLLKWLWSTTHGVFDLQAVTQERIHRFKSKNARDVYSVQFLTNMAAECYQQSSLNIQMEGGKLFIQTDVLPQPRATILDLGCGTGELSAYIAELAGPEGYVVGVDPDSNRLKVTQETHCDVKNLSFAEGQSDPGRGGS